MDRRAFVTASLAAAFVPARAVAQQCGSGRFPRPLNVRNLTANGRLRQLRASFDYIERCGQSWRVPTQWIVDGASIPRILWPVVGRPWEGDYVKASVIHDYHCDRRIIPWHYAHSLFLEGMVAGGVDHARAKRMYTAVYYGGPRWTWQAMENNRMAAGLPPFPSPPFPSPPSLQPPSSQRWSMNRSDVSPVGGSGPSVGPVAPPPPPINPDTLRRLIETVEIGNLPPGQLEGLVERNRPNLPEDDD